MATFQPSEHLQHILASLPTKPGCYLMKNAAGEIISELTSSLNRHKQRIARKT